MIYSHFDWGLSLICQGFKSGVNLLFLSFSFLRHFTLMYLQFSWQSSLLPTWFYLCMVCLTAQLETQQGRFGCRGLLTMQCTLPTRIGLSNLISAFTYSQHQQGREARWETESERKGEGWWEGRKDTATAGCLLLQQTQGEVREWQIREKLI